jgi:glycosyltransferase involved in cell wall biosynthesis
MKDGLLSVIVRTVGFDLELLEKCLLSIQNSDYSTIEIIVVYQGIDSVKLNLIKNLKLNVSYSVLINEVEYDDRSKNLNLGLSMSKGSYLAFLDDDDFVSRNHYSNLIELLVKEKSSLAYCLCNVVNKEGVILDDIFKNRYLDKIGLKKDNFITIHSFVINKKNIDSSFLYFKEDLKLAEDYIFILPIFINFKTSYHPERTSFYLIPEKESNSFTTYKSNGEYVNQRNIMNKYRREINLNLFERASIYYKRITGKTRRIS